MGRVGSNAFGKLFLLPLCCCFRTQLEENLVFPGLRQPLLPPAAKSLPIDKGMSDPIGEK